MIARVYRINRMHVPCKFTMCASNTHITRCCFHRREKLAG